MVKTENGRKRIKTQEYDSIVCSLNPLLQEDPYKDKLQVIYNGLEKIDHYRMIPANSSVGEDIFNFSF